MVAAVVVAEVALQGQLGEAEGDLVGAVDAQIVKGVDAPLADDRLVLGDGGDVGGGERHRGVRAEDGGQALPAEVVAVADEAGKGDLLGDALLQFGEQLRLAADGLSLLALAGQVLADAGPELAVGRCGAGHGVVGDGDAGHLDDAGLDGVDEGEVGDDPGEECPLRVAGAAEEERGGGEVVDGLDADLGLDRLQPADPDAGFLVALPGFLAVLAGQLLVDAVRFAPVAVVGLVVDDDDLFLRPQLAADAAAGDDVLGDAVVVEAEMAVGFGEGGVDDGVGDDDIAHANALLTWSWDGLDRAIVAGMPIVAASGPSVPC